MSDEYKFGIEEEYFLVDAATKSVAREMPDSFLAKLKSMTGGQVMGEMLQSQIEVFTCAHSSILRVTRALARSTTLAEAATIAFPRPDTTS